MSGARRDHGEETLVAWSWSASTLFHRKSCPAYVTTSYPYVPKFHSLCTLGGSPWRQSDYTVGRVMILYGFFCSAVRDGLCNDF